MAVNAEAALRMLRERGRQFIARGMVDYARRGSDELFALAEAAADAGEQTRYLDALRIWNDRQRALGAGLARRVEQGFAALGGTTAAGDAAAADGLRLMDEEELAELILVDAIAAASRAALRAPLAELLGRLEQLTGAAAAPRQLPLAPDFVLGACARELAPLGLAAGPRRVLLRACEASLLSALPATLTQANELLHKLGVGLPPGAAPPTRDEDAEGGAAGAPAAPDPDPGATTAAAAAPGQQRPAPRRPARSRRLAATLTAGAPPAGDAAAELAQLLEGLARQPPAAPGSGPRLLAQAQAALARDGRDLDALHPLDRQLLTLVDTLFAAMAEGTWMPRPLGELLGAAEVPVAALASNDPTFIDKPWHPGRRLLNEIIGAATDYLDPDGGGDTELFRQAAAAIAALGRPDAGPQGLARLLAGFMAVVERERERADKLAERALQEAAARERTDLAHGRVAAVLGARLGGRVWPLALLNLVERAWCRVLFLAWFRAGESAPQWRSAVHLLDQVVGVLGDAVPDAELVARLWQALAERLDEIAFDSFAARRLLDELRGCVGAAPHAPVPGVVWTPQEARELGDPRQPVLVDTLRLALPGEPEVEDCQPGQALSDVDLSRADSLRVGGWIEFDDAGGERVRARLLGVVQPSGVHLLGAGNGGVPRRVSKRRLALALREGRLLALDNSQLFEQALERALERVAANQ